MTMEIVSNSLAEAAAYIAEAWRDGIESIIETGRRLIEKRKELKDKPGEWSRLIGDNQWAGNGLLPFTPQHAYRLIKIAEDKRLLTHVLVLPSDTYTLYQLTRLSADRFDELLASGAIHPGMKRTEAPASQCRPARDLTRRRLPGAAPGYAD